MENKILPPIIAPAEFAEFQRSKHQDCDIRIVDLSQRGNFLNGHIPGAVFLPHESLICGRTPAPGKLPPMAQLQDVFQYLGLNDNTHFVVCDDEGGGWAGRFIWTLDVIDHQHYSYIDGGMIAWKAEGLPLASGQPQNSYRSDSPPKLAINKAPTADLNDILEGLGSDTFIVWDARSPQEYEGSRVVAAKGGHIPGAKNAEWTSLMDLRRHYKIRLDAKAYLREIGIDGSTPIITHCQTHHRSGFTYLVGKSLGYDIKAYPGSWSEWGNHPDTPVEI